ncbi:MAG: hypothetical protein HYU66_18235, partial [Armatimonadetes bacterium]|nr:hypothetical protein [Armatimonadota bacterium]
MGRTWSWVSEFLWGPENASTDGTLALEPAPAPPDERPRRIPADEEPPGRPAPPPKRGWGLRGQEGVVELRPSQPRVEVKFPRNFDE